MYSSFHLSLLPSTTTCSTLPSTYKNIYSCIFFTPLSFTLSIYQCIHPPLPGSSLNLNIFTTYHSSIHPQRGIEEHGHSAEWVELANAACTTGMEGMGRGKDWEGRQRNYSRMESLWNEEGATASVYLIHIFHSVSAAPPLISLPLSRRI